MRFKKVYLNDFKCFKDIELELGRITILTGANSSGKSSIIQSILAPLQSSNFPFTLSTNGKYVNLGDFEDISYMHKKDKIIHLNYAVANEDFDIDIETSWLNNAINRLPKLLTLKATAPHYKLTMEYKEDKYLLSFQYFAENDPENKSGYTAYQMTLKMNKLIDDFIKEKSEKNNEEKNETKETAMQKLYKKLEESFNKNNRKIKFSAPSIEELRKKISKQGSYALIAATKNLENFFHEFEHQFNFISSFRYNPQKMRFEIAKSNLKVGRHGENYEDQIVLWELNKSSKYNELISIMSELNLFEDIKAKRVPGGNYHLTVQTHKHGTFSSITDVGFGISQFLPIIVADIQLESNSSLIVSQPEIHLHPSVQSDFGDFMVKRIKAPLAKNYIIETHSEYLLNKLRLLIVKGELKSEDLRVHYISNKGNNVEHYKIEFTEEGKILNAPQEFFDTYMTDVMDIALNA